MISLINYDSRARENIEVVIIYPYIHIYIYIYTPIGSMYAIYGNIYHPINIPPMLAYMPAPWILWDIYIYTYIIIYIYTYCIPHPVTTSETTSDSLPKRACLSQQNFQRIHMTWRRRKANQSQGLGDATTPQYTIYIYDIYILYN